MRLQKELHYKCENKYTKRSLNSPYTKGKPIFTNCAD